MAEYNELVKRLRELHPEEFDNQWDFAFACQQAMHEAADAIEDLITALTASNEVIAKSKPKWIPVSERLPEKEDMVIFYYAWTGRTGTVYKEVTLATLAELEHVGSKPIAWMPLPQPPKGEEDGRD